MRLLVVVGVCVLLVASPATATTTAAATGEPPLAEAGLDQTVQRGAGVILDAGGSRDPDGEVTGYDWRIEAPNGTTLTPECSDCERTRFTADAVGEYNVTVEVTDDDGNTANDTLYVTVESPPDGPTVSLSGNTAPSVDAPARYDATATAGDAELETVEWTVDGRSATEQEVDGESATRSLIRAFDDASSRTVRVTVTDEAGRTATDALRVDPRAERSDSGPPEDPANAPEPASKPQAIETPTDLCRDNQAPQVSASVGTVRGYAYVNSETNDPDGSITDTRYDPRSVISVPEVGKTKTITVTVQDDCGTTDSDTVLVSRDSNKKVVEKRATKQVEYENVIELQYQRGAGGPPTGSKIISGRRSDLPGTVSGEVDTPPEEQAVHDSSRWKVLADYKRGDGDPNKKTDGKYEAVQDAEKSEQTETKTVTVTETKTTTTTEAKTDISPFSKDGKTVRKDLNNDGKIDITDWQQEYPAPVSRENLVNDLGGGAVHVDSASQSKTPTRSTNNDNKGTSDDNDDSNDVERTNNDHDNDGHKKTKRGAAKDDDNDGTIEVCSNGYCMNVDTGLHNT